MKNFIKLTQTPKCETFLLNLDYVICIDSYGEGSYVTIYVSKHCRSGVTVLESPKEIWSLINIKGV